MSINFKGRFARRITGYTLLELLLALGLTVIVVSLIATAIQTNGLTLTRVQASIERKQAARGILGMMQNDLRAGIQYKANEYAGLQDLFRSIQLAGIQAPIPVSESESDAPEDQLAQLEELAQLAGVDSADAAGSDSRDSNGDSDSEFEEIEEPDADGAPVFIGASNFVSIDISRLPRIDEYHPSIVSQQQASNTLADVKTVSYFVSGSNGPNERRGTNVVQIPRGQTTVSGGLFRRQVDRSVSKFEGLERSGEPDRFSELVAQEVVEISFRYFDGSNWFPEWSSEDMGGFPLAVEVYVLIDPARAGSIGTAGSGSTSRDKLETYRAVVHIPAAEIVEQEEDDG